MKRSIELLSHFQCDQCTNWFSIGDAPLGKSDWYCPWCGSLWKEPLEEFSEDIKGALENVRGV